MMGTTGTTGTIWGRDHRDNGDHGHGEPHGDLLGAMGMTQGRRGDHGDNKITKNAITFE